MKLELYISVNLRLVFFWVVLRSIGVGGSQRVGLSWAVELSREVGFSQMVQGLFWAIEFRLVGCFLRG